ncbi:MAG: acetate--CoA ligase family protein [Candidatus Alcyoniella australis]|nr:acetate--CoA ligase family protein [Candidatus Alcyoniella australis]
MDIIASARAAGLESLTEHDAKKLIKAYDVPITPEQVVQDADAALAAAQQIGYPVALKATGAKLLHKTEHKAIRLGIDDDDELRQAADELLAADIPGREGLLVQKMIGEGRELLVGMTRDPQFGPVVAFGLGGVFTEILKDVALRVAPLDKVDALEMIDQIRGRKILDEFRGMPAVDRDRLAQILINVGTLALELPDVAELDINPLMIGPEGPLAVDALVRLTPQATDE